MGSSSIHTEGTAQLATRPRRGKPRAISRYQVPLSSVAVAEPVAPRRPLLLPPQASFCFEPLEACPGNGAGRTELGYNSQLPKHLPKALPEHPQENRPTASHPALPQAAQSTRPRAPQPFLHSHTQRNTQSTRVEPCCEPV